jgi:hypothetical protein
MTIGPAAYIWVSMLATQNLMAMKHFRASLFALLVSAEAIAQPTPEFPPVPGNDFVKDNYGLIANPGWVLNTNGIL